MKFKNEIILFLSLKGNIISALIQPVVSIIDTLLIVFLNTILFPC